MYSKDELKQLTTEFWTTFGQFSQLKRSKLKQPKKWMLYQTGIKGLVLKFEQIDQASRTLIEIELSQVRSELYINRMAKLVNSIQQPKGFDAILFSQKSEDQTYRYFFEMQGQTLKNKMHWPEIFRFFFEHMLVLEHFVIQHKDEICPECD